MLKLQRGKTKRKPNNVELPQRRQGDITRNPNAMS